MRTNLSDNRTTRIIPREAGYHELSGERKVTDTLLTDFYLGL